jgi:hypothetical protein
MSDHPAPVEIQTGPVENVQNWLHENGENVLGIEQKLSLRDSNGYPARTMITKRKAKRKDDGPLEIVCGWIVEHQIGTAMSPKIQIDAAIDQRIRTLCQFIDALGLDPYVLPSRTEAFPQILRTLLLQPGNW